jgi:hypothetical protein
VIYLLNNLSDTHYIALLSYIYDDQLINNNKYLEPSKKINKSKEPGKSMKGLGTDEYKTHIPGELGNFGRKYRSWDGTTHWPPRLKNMNFSM